MHELRYQEKKKEVMHKIVPTMSVSTFETYFRFKGASIDACRSMCIYNVLV